MQVQAEMQLAADMQAADMPAELAAGMQAAGKPVPERQAVCTQAQQAADKPAQVHMQAEQEQLPVQD